MKKIVWTFGLIAGAIMAVMMLITMTLHQHVSISNAYVLGYATMVAALLLVFFGVRAYRNDVAGGTVSFGRAFGVGMLIVLVASACYAAAWEVVRYTGTMDFDQQYAVAQAGRIRASGKPQDEIDRELARQERFMALYENPIINAGVTMLEPLPVGLILALVSAGVLSRRRPD